MQNKRPFQISSANTLCFSPNPLCTLLGLKSKDLLRFVPLPLLHLSYNLFPEAEALPLLRSSRLRTLRLGLLPVAHHLLLDRFRRVDFLLKKSAKC